MIRPIYPLYPFLFFIICILLILKSGWHVYFILSNPEIFFDDKYLISVAINAFVVFAAIFAVLKFHWGKIALLIILYMLAVANIFGAFTKPNFADHLAWVAILGLIIFYIHTSINLKEAFKLK